MLRAVAFNIIYSAGVTCLENTIADGLNPLLSGAAS